MLGALNKPRLVMQRWCILKGELAHTVRDLNTGDIANLVQAKD